MSQPVGRVVAIAVKSAKRGPMVALERAKVTMDGGIAGGPKPSAKRGITLLARDKWEDALREAGAELHWHARRANVLVEGLDLGALVGRRVRLGGVELIVGGETKPCPRMDEAHQGLQEALRPECRAGVYGRIVGEGEFGVGDAVVVMED